MQQIGFAYTEVYNARRVQFRSCKVKILSGNSREISGNSREMSGNTRPPRIKFAICCQLGIKNRNERKYRQKMLLAGKSAN